MASVVADTHAVVWYLTQPKRLGRAARRYFGAADAGRTTCYVPVVAFMEIALLHERGRIPVAATQVLEAIAGQPGYMVLPVDLEQALEFSTLLAIRDPFDRMIVSAARATRSRLVSADEALDGQGVERIWD